MMATYGPVSLILNWRTYERNKRNLYYYPNLRALTLTTLSLILLLAGEHYGPRRFLTTFSEWLQCASGLCDFFFESNAPHGLA